MINGIHGYKWDMKGIYNIANTMIFGFAWTWTSGWYVTINGTCFSGYTRNTIFIGWEIYNHRVFFWLWHLCGAFSSPCERVNFWIQSCSHSSVDLPWISESLPSVAHPEIVVGKQYQNTYDWHQIKAVAFFFNRVSCSKGNECLHSPGPEIGTFWRLVTCMTWSSDTEDFGEIFGVMLRKHMDSYRGFHK